VLTVSVVVPEPVSEDGLKPAIDTPEGMPPSLSAEKLTVPEKPLIGVRVTV
jgi:hypothetical protein